MPGSGYLITEVSTCVVRKVDGAGTIQTIAGNGSCAHSGDTGPATSAALDTPIAAVPTPDGGYLIAEFGNLIFSTGGRVRKVGADGNINTVAGTGTPGYSGDGGPATAATAADPRAPCPRWEVAS